MNGSKHFQLSAYDVLIIRNLVKDQITVVERQLRSFRDASQYFDASGVISMAEAELECLSSLLYKVDA